MEQRLPIQAKIFIALLAVSALLLSAFLYRQADFSSFTWASVFIFLIIAVISDSFPVSMPRGGAVSVGFASLFASILLFEPFIVVCIAVLGDALSVRKGRNLPKYIFNAAQMAISLGTSAILYRFLNPDGLTASPRYFLAALAALLACFLLNSILVTLILALVQNIKPYLVWVTNVKWATPNFFSMAPLGMLIALIYIHVGFWGLVLFLLPLVLARHSFQSYMDMRQAFLDTIHSLSIAIDAKDPYTRGHSSRVAELAVALARKLKWPEDRVELFQYIAMIHDVGKVAVPESILKKPEKLAPDEIAEMENHAVIGSEVIRNIKFFQNGTDIIRHHHERWDGTGYPSGLKGDEIPYGSRILAVADAFDAMISDRPYRKALPLQSALQEIRAGSGNQFDPRVVAAFEELYPGLAGSLFPGKNSELPLYMEEAAAAAENSHGREYIPAAGVAGTKAELDQTPAGG